MYIQRHGRAPEAIAKHFMQQLGLSYTYLSPSLLLHFFIVISHTM